VRLIGGPRHLDGRLWSDPSSATADRVLVAVHQSRACPLEELRAQCTDRETIRAITSRWQVAAYVRSGRRRRVRADLFRYEATFTLVPFRDHRGRWSLRPGPAALPGVTDLSAVVAPAAGAAGAATLDTDVWTYLEDGVDRAAERFRRIAGLLPDGPLSERTQTTQAAVDASVRDATRLCQVGASIAPDWQPGSAGDAAAAIVARVTALIGTVDEAIVELVRLHLAVEDIDEVAGETLGLLVEAVQELAESHQRGDQDDVRNNRDRH